MACGLLRFQCWNLTHDCSPSPTHLLMLLVSLENPWRVKVHLVNSKCLNLQCMIYSMFNNFVIEISIKSKPKHFRNWGANLVLLKNLLISRILCRDFIIFNLKCWRCWILNSICHCKFKKNQNNFLRIHTWAKNIMKSTWMVPGSGSTRVVVEA